jgi:hypothetical protein
MNLPKKARQGLERIPLSKMRLAETSERRLSSLLKQAVEHRQKSWDAEIGIDMQFGLTRKQECIVSDFVTDVAAEGKLRVDFHKQSQRLWRKIVLDLQK